MVEEVPDLPAKNIGLAPGSNRVGAWAYYGGDCLFTWRCLSERLPWRFCCPQRRVSSGSPSTFRARGLEMIARAPWVPALAWRTRPQAGRHDRRVPDLFRCATRNICGDITGYRKRQRPRRRRTRTTWKTPESNYTGTFMAIMFFFLGALWFFLFVPLATSIPSATGETVGADVAKLDLKDFDRGGGHSMAKCY